MTDVSYNSSTNLISWTYNSTLNFVDIYKLNNNIINYSISDISFNNINTSYSINVSNIHLMGEEGITNANPYLLNIDQPSSYMLGLSGPGISFFTSNTFDISENQTITDVSGIPTYDSSTNTISFYYNAGVTFVDVYKVDSINNRRYISATAKIPNTDSLPNYIIDVSGVPLYDNSGQLDTINNTDGTYYLGVRNFPTFTISGFFDIVSNTVSSQWNRVLQDNIKLMKAGLYNTDTTNPYHYIFGTQPENLSAYSYIPTSEVHALSSSALNQLRVDTINTKMLLNNDTSNYKLGINNCICDINIGPTGGGDGATCYIRTSSNYITLDKGTPLYREFNVTYHIEYNSKTITVVNPYTVGYYTILNLYPFKYDVSNPYIVMDIVFTRLPYKNIGSEMSSPWTDNEVIVKYDSNTFSDFTDWFVNETPGQPGPSAEDIDFYTILPGQANYPSYPNINDNLILRLQVAAGYKVKDPIPTLDNNLIIQWGSNSTTASLEYGINYRSGPCTMNINIPESEASGFSSYIYYITDDSIEETQLNNSFVISSGCTFEDTYNPPGITYTLDTIRYSHLSNLPLELNGITSIEKAGFYIPSMIPGGDYAIQSYTTSGVTLHFVQGSDTKMTADRCRQPWRLSHYVRANNIPSPPSDRDTDVIKIGYNTAAALVYNASMDPNATSTIPGKLTLSVDMCNLTNSYDGYSGDMVPPVIALIDALDITGYSLEAGITAYANNVKNLNISDGSLTTLIDNLETDETSSSTYPLLDSVKSGGQQLGLAGCGFVCTKDFLSRENFDVMAKYDRITSWDGSYNSYTRINNKTFTDETFNNLITVYKMLAMRGNGFKTWENWPADNPLNKTWAECILSNAYITNLRIRDINILEKDELSFGPASSPNQPISTLSYAAGCTHPIPIAPSVTSTNNPPVYDANYIYTHFPMIGIPDSGWGSLTIEIFSYYGIVFAAMNDYRMFCKWHRAYWHMLFIQNGGDMYGWVNKSIKKEDSSVNISSSKMWLPTYLRAEDSTGSNQTWIPDIVNKYKLHYFTIYEWPPENYYSESGTGYSSNTTESKTNFWANRQCPYRGDDEAGTKFRWSTPSYCMGYSPAWIAGGKTTGPPATENQINKPVAEALNPFFTNSLGLYSATDGDQNVLQAYLLASLQWPTTPTESDFSQPFNSGIYDKYSPPNPTVNPSLGSPYGYDCDVCDFFYNTEIPNSSTNAISDNSKGVFWAVDKGYGYDNSVEITTANGILDDPLCITDKIGYGVTTTDANNWYFPTVTENGTTKRCTTWAYIAESIQRTIISTNGCGFSGDYGNFARIPQIPLADPAGARFATLGHDTNTGLSNTFKLDYIDARIYQLCKKLTQTS
jgi:hypothetical protein